VGGWKFRHQVIYFTGEIFLLFIELFREPVTVVLRSEEHLRVPTDDVNIILMVDHQSVAGVKIKVPNF
jgi:hypothetical protein